MSARVLPLVVRYLEDAYEKLDSLEKKIVSLEVKNAFSSRYLITQYAVTEISKTIEVLQEVKAFVNDRNFYFVILHHQIFIRDCPEATQARRAATDWLNDLSHRLHRLVILSTQLLCAAIPLSPAQFLP